MKKAFSILAVSLAALSQAAFAESFNSLFLKGSAGAAYNSVEGKMSAYGGKVSADNAAASFGIDAGMSFSHRVQAYLGADISVGGGDMDLDIGTKDVDYFATGFHIGCMGFPFGQASALKGAFVGVEFGADEYEVGTSKINYLDDEWRLSMGLKVGHTWSITKIIDLGVEATFDYHMYPFDDDTFLRGSLRDMSGYTIGLNFVAMHK